jgi:arylsulfatase A-like enzyme
MLSSGNLVAAALLVTVGCTSDRRHQPPNIVVLVLDTARPDLLAVYGYPRPTSPFLESFAASGARFDRAYSSSSWTLPAHGSLFTGLPPELHQGNQTSKRVADSIPLLQEELSAAGFQTAGFSGNIWVSELGGLARGFEHFENLNQGIYRPHVRELAADREGRRTPPEKHYIASRVRTWLEEHRDSTRPFYVFVNLVEPHLPYLPPWEAARHFMASPEERFDAIQRFYPDAKTKPFLLRHYAREEPISVDEWRTLTKMYEGALRSVDEIAASIVEAIDGTSDPENTIIFIISDHGENLGDHSHATHIFNLYDTNLRIACLARGPGFAPGMSSDALVQITDVHATVLRAAGVELPPRAHGVDLRAEIPAPRTLTAVLEYPTISLGLFPARVSRTGALDAYKVKLSAAIGPRFKVIRATDRDGRLVREEVYDLRDDPRETTPLNPADVDSDVLNALRQAISTHATNQTQTPLEELDDDVLESLRALGYVP